MTRGPKSESTLLAEAKAAAARAKKLEQALILENRKRAAVERKFREQLREMQTLREQLRVAQSEIKVLKEQLI